MNKTLKSISSIIDSWFIDTLNEIRNNESDNKKIFSGSITNKINKLKKPINKSISYKSMKH